MCDDTYGLKVMGTPDGETMIVMCLVGIFLVRVLGEQIMLSDAFCGDYSSESHLENTL